MEFACAEFNQRNGGLNRLGFVERLQLAQRLPSEAHKLKSESLFDFANTSLLERIIELIEHRCALTIGRLTKQSGKT